jgi:pimeloyl-ACP methyl ester carboxylesterase
MLNATPVLGPALSRRMIRSMTPRELINDSLLRITYDRGRVPLDMVESFVALAEVRRDLPWAADAVPKTGASIRRLFARRSQFVRMVRDISAPTLVVQGIGDHIVSPTAVEWLCYLRPDWDLVQMNDTGHTPQVDAPIRLLSVLDPWLDEHLKREMTA